MSTTNLKSNRAEASTRVALLLALVISSLMLGTLMILTSVDVPRADEWNTPGEYLRAIARGNVTFDHLFRQHNESRVIFVQLLTGLFGMFWGWNEHALHAVNWMLLTATAFLFIRLVTETLLPNQRLSRSALFVVGVAVALVFTPVQWRNFLSGGQIITIVIPFLLTFGLWLNLKDHLPAWARYSSAALCALIASFSFVNGLMLWFLLWPAPVKALRLRSLRVGKTEVLASALYFALALAVIFSYLADYHTPAGHPALASGLSAPHHVLFFALTWLAGPIFPQHVYLWWHDRHFLPLILCGGLAASAGLLAVVYLAHRRKALWSSAMTPQLYPFFILLTYSLASATSTAVARVGLGIFGNMSRYSTVAVPAYLGLAGIIAHLSVGNASAAARRVLQAFAVTFAAAVMVAAVTGGASCFLDKAEAKQARLSLDFRNLSPDDPLIWNVFPAAGYVRDLANELEQFGVLKPTPDYSWINVQAAKESDLQIRVEATLVDTMNTIRGTVVPNGSLEDSDVLVAWDDRNSRPFTALLAPSAANYLGKPAGFFEAKVNPVLVSLPKFDAHTFLIARPRTHEIWRLKRL